MLNQRSRHLPSLTFCLVASLLVSGLVQAQSRETIIAAIEKALDKAKIDSLSVTMEGETVVLKGDVRNVFMKDKAVAIALEQGGVEDVETDIEISQGESDNDVAKEVIKQIRGYASITLFDDISAGVQNGEVVLFGFVTEPFKVLEIDNRMERVLGIVSYENKIEVLPNLQGDARLRQTLANRLYGDSTFSDYASQPIPPIHIIVKNSRVLLTGVVRSQLEVQKAASIIRQTPGVLSVENRLKIGS